MFKDQSTAPVHKYGQSAENLTTQFERMRNDL